MKLLARTLLKVSNRYCAVLLSLACMTALPSAIALDDVTGFQAEDCGAGCGYAESASGTSATIDFTKNNSTVSFETLSLDTGEQLNANGTQAGWNLLVNVRGALPSTISGTVSGNAGHVVLSNTNGIVFDGAQILNIGQMVATTGVVNNFSSGAYIINSMDQGEAISVGAGGLNATIDGLAMVARDIDIDGDVSVIGGELQLKAGAKASVSYANGLMTIDITEALNSSQTALAISNGSTVTATNIDIEAALLGDPLALAINQRGVLKATGISNEGGVIRLRGDGARMFVAGELDTRNQANEKAGSVELVANTVFLAGHIVSDSVVANIGATGALGQLTLFENPSLDFNLNQLQITGAGESNHIEGLANYIISGDDSGTAAYEGIGSAAGDFSNVGAISFNNVSDLSATRLVENAIVITNSGNLSGTVSGNEGNDTFLVQGFAAGINGKEGEDTVTMDGGFAQFIDGGSSKSIDQLINVEAPVFDDLQGLSGRGDNVGSWVNFEGVIAAVIVEPPNVIDEVNVPLAQPINVNALQTVSLGLVGDGSELRLPCGFAHAPAEMPAIDPEIDCTDQYNSPEYQQLISSLIHFDNDSYAISAASAERLNKIADFFIESNRFDQLQLSGHTDSNASESYNLRLSERRVASTSNYLQQKGINEAAIEGFAFGESLPAKPNTSEENLAYNRRVHIELK